jgi:GAF domain-containing protein/HAMP domain-containing protein
MFIRFLRQLSVRSRIVGGFVILLVFMTLSVPLIVINHFALTNRVQQLANVEAKADRLLLLALSNVLSSRVNLVRYADDMTSSPSDALNDISQATKLLEEARTLITDPAQKKAANDILAGLASYSNLVVEIQNARIQNRSQDAYILLFNSYQLDFTLDQQIRRVVADSETRIDAANQAALDEAQQRLILLVAGYIILILFAIVITIVVQRSITRPISELRKGAETFRLNKKETSIPYEGTDELSVLAQTFNQLTAELAENFARLEQRVAERTTDLEQRSKELADRTVQLELANVRTQKRAAQFQAIADVSSATASVRKLNELLPRIANVVSEQFGFYHTGIFLLDEAGQYAILSAANSEGGKRMLERGHRLKVGDQGIVGYVTNLGEPRIALDTGTDAVFFDNPDLPETRSELAIPLKSGGKIIGALDVQSTQSNAFSQEDSEVLQILADQISAAIDNARQFEQTQKSLSEVETIYRQYLRREWGRLGQSESMMGYRHTIAGTEQLERPYENSKIDEALASGTIQTDTDPENNESMLAVPIKLRDEVIGVLNVHAPRKRAWSTDEINMVKSVADRVAISAENARLFEETTNRAERERTVSEITSKIRSTNDPDEMIQIALEELKQALNVNVARVVPYTPPQSQKES